MNTSVLGVGKLEELGKIKKEKTSSEAGRKQKESNFIEMASSIETEENLNKKQFLLILEKLLVTLIRM